MARIKPRAPVTRRRRGGFRIRFKKTFPFIKLGSSPVEHVRKMRRALPQVHREADAAIHLASKGDCARAVEAYGSAQWYKGYVQAHESSTSKKTYSGISPHMRRVDFATTARKLIKARKAVEACLVRR